MSEQLLEVDQEKLNEAREFLSGFRSVILGSVTARGLPHTSYAPFVADQGCFFIYVSSLAQHAASLKNGQASLFFIEDETTAKTIFARKRLTIDCRAKIIHPKETGHEHILDLLQARHGSTVELLRTLPDFILFELAPTRAGFVTGFGAAFDLTPCLDRLGQGSDTT